VALTEQFLGRPCGDNPAELLSYSIHPHTGALTLLNDVTLPDFCSTAVITDPSGKFVYVASIHFDPDKFGEIDGFESSNGQLTPLPGSPFVSPVLVPAGQNPAIQSLAMTHDGKVVYASDPNDAAGILIFDRDTQTGALAFRSAFNSGSPFGPMAITPSGGFLIAMAPIFLGNGGGGVFEYAIGDNGDLTPVPGSPFAAPDSGFASALSISPNGSFIASAGSGGVSVQRETPDGQLSLVPGSPFGGGLPPAITFDTSGSFVYVPGTVFRIDPETGALTQVSNFTTGNAAEGITAVRPL
jgi:6-phosphogluconolactonase (cycloisomerase 2 family)